jgi:hypothetical protein
MQVRPSIKGALAATLAIAAGSAMAALPEGVDGAFTTLMTDFGTLATSAAVAIIGIPVALKGYALFKRVWAKV